MRLRYRYLILLCSLFIALPGVAQELAVESFRLLENEISPNIEGPNKRIDQNGEVAALIKIQTTEKGFVFEGGLLGIVDTKQDVGEIYVWVPRSAKFITIKHPQLGVLRNYAYPIPIESGRAYEMKLISGRVRQIVEYSTTEHYFVLNVSPANARVTIDGNPVTLNSEGAVSVLLKRGTHEFSIQAAMHRSEVGIVTITDKKEIMNVTLAPDYGVLQVGSEPQGAEVYIDGAYKPAGTTPFTSEWLSSGTHSLEFRLPSYKVYTTDVQVVGDGTTQPLSATLQPNFAEVTISAPGEADIYINDAHKATGSWSGRLDAGHYRVEARKASHTSSVQSLDVVAGDSRHITLDAPKPIYGSLNINSDPIGARVFIDGKEIGEAPDIFTQVLVGTRTIRLIKSGYTPIEQQITIETGKTLSLNLSLSQSADNSIVNSVSDTTISLEARVFTVNGVSFTMIPIVGGTFTMGATPEQGSDAESDEKPSHQVRLDSYYIGETEVTQGLWEAVMGTTVRDKAGENRELYGEGHSYPMYYISWEDCQEFIEKLNQLTGQKFRLPTEAEWEYAARGGNKSQGYKYAGTNKERQMRKLVYQENGPYMVKTQKANELGLYDMSGNVSEWCADWYGKYSGKTQHNPIGSVIGPYRVNRGGSWFDVFINSYRVSERNFYTPDRLNGTIGFRLALGGNKDVTANLENDTIVASKENIPLEIEKAHIIVEQMPYFPGGEVAMMEYIRKNLRYPVLAQERGLEGIVTVRFVVNKVGEVQDVTVLRGVHELLDKEAVRIVQSLPRWIPGIQNGEPVSVYYNVPVMFKLQ